MIQPTTKRQIAKNSDTSALNLAPELADALQLVNEWQRGAEIAEIIQDVGGKIQNLSERDRTIVANYITTAIKRTKAPGRAKTRATKLLDFILNGHGYF